MPIFVGAWAGAVIGALLAIVYDTSANTAALEGAQRHLTFRQGLFWTLIGAGAGAFVGLIVWAAREDFPQRPDA